MAAVLTVTVDRAFAQVVAPPAFTATEASTFQTAPTHTNAFTYQMQIAAAQLTGLTAGQSINGVRFRLDGNSTFVQTMSYASYSVRLSQAANSITGMSNDYLANELNAVTVYNAPLTFLASDFPTAGIPRAFGPSITFSTPYTYQGGDLVLFLTHSASPTSSGVGVMLDAAASQLTDTGYRGLISSGQNAATAVGTVSVLVTQFVTGPGAVSAPEPGTLALLAMAALPLVGIIARRRKQ
jgi:hypothetical protein